MKKIAAILVAFAMSTTVVACKKKNDKPTDRRAPAARQGKVADRPAATRPTDRPTDRRTTTKDESKKKAPAPAPTKKDDNKEDK